METLVENRGKTRTNLTWPVSVWHPQAGHFYNGYSANISETGVYINIPAAAPFSEGNIVEINFPRTNALASKKGGYARIKCGKVVRVERRNMLQDAKIGLAVQFE